MGLSIGVTGLPCKETVSRVRFPPRPPPDSIHSPETKHKMSLSGSGEKNSNFGTCWGVKENVKPFKIKKEQLDEYILNGYSRGRKVL